jgi:hypothetical protein
VSLEFRGLCRRHNFGFRGLTAPCIGAVPALRNIEVTLKVAGVMYTEAFEYLQDTTWLKPGSRSSALHGGEFNYFIQRI